VRARGLLGWILFPFTSLFFFLFLFFSHANCSKEDMY
jgi:hypothetical protein